MAPEWWIALGFGVCLLTVIALRGRDGAIRMPASESIDSEPPPDFLERLPRLGLRARETEFLGRWWEGTERGRRFAFQPMGKGIAIFAGDFEPDAEQISSVYLSQVDDAAPLPPDDSPRRLLRVLGDEGAELDARFILNATGGTCPELRSTAVRSALIGLSDSVREVMLFESAGVELVTDESATSESLRADLDRALELHGALAALE